MKEDNYEWKFFSDNHLKDGWNDYEVKKTEMNDWVTSFPSKYD